MTRGSRVLAAALTWLALAPVASAHRLDEYLQAARVGIARDRIDVELDLTPGVAVASRVVDAIDLDRDGSVSAGEKAAYAGHVARAVTIMSAHLGRTAERVAR